MRVTPLEIRQKTFEKKLRGYDKDEVNGFLQTLSQEWERSVDENKELRIKLEATEREVMKLREVESSLYKTLKTAEDTGANVIEQARQSAELNMRESTFKAEAMLSEAKMRAKDMIEESDMRAKEILAEMEDRLKLLADNYKKLEAHRDDLMSELKRLAGDTLDRVERAKNSVHEFDADQYLNQVKREAKKAIFPNQNYKASPPVAPIVKEQIAVKETPAPLIEKQVPVKETPKPVESPVMEEMEIPQQEVYAQPVQPQRKVQKSFFDEIA